MSMKPMRDGVDPEFGRHRVHAIIVDNNCMFVQYQGSLRPYPRRSREGLLGQNDLDRLCRHLDQLSR